MRKNVKQVSVQARRLAASAFACHAHNHARTLTCCSFFPTDFQGKETARSLPHYQSEPWCTTIGMKMSLICIMKSHFINGHQDRFEREVKSNCPVRFLAFSIDRAIERADSCGRQVFLNIFVCLMKNPR